MNLGDIVTYSKKMRKARRRDGRKRVRNSKIDHKRKESGSHSDGGTLVSSEEMKESHGNGEKD